MFMPQTKEQIQILNGNNHFCRMTQTEQEIFAKEITRPTLESRNVMSLSSYIENISVSNDATIKASICILN